MAEDRGERRAPAEQLGDEPSGGSPSLQGTALPAVLGGLRPVDGLLDPPRPGPDGEAPPTPCELFEGAGGPACEMTERSGGRAAAPPVRATPVPPWLLAFLPLLAVALGILLVRLLS